MYFGTVALILLLLLATTVLVGQARSRRMRGRCQSRLLELERICCLRHLLELLQQHRGLIFGEMSGEASLHVRRWAVHQEILAQLDRCKVHESSLQWYPGWHQALALWTQIAGQEDAGADVLLRLHNRMLALLLETIRGIAERHDLECLGTLAAQPCGCWLQLLEHAEMLGQARAIGTGIAARRGGDAVLRTELEELRERIAEQAYLPLAQLHADPQLRSFMATGVQEAEDSLDRFLELIDQLVAAEQNAGPATVSYFQTATHAITAHLVLADQLLERLKKVNQDGL